MGKREKREGEWVGKRKEIERAVWWWGGGRVKGDSYRWKKGGEREKKWVEECFGIDEKWGKERG